MNIFVLDTDTNLAAKYHCDKHVVKMILETAQLLCTAHHLNGSKNPDNIPYRKTHFNHPCAVWCRESLLNYNWLCDLGMELCIEYSNRYNKIHKTQAVIKWCIDNKPISFPNTKFTKWPLAMPNTCKISNDIVECYRHYYKEEKKVIAKWNYSNIPEWW